MNERTNNPANAIAQALIVERFFAEHPLGVLASVDAAYRPHTAVVYAKVEEGFVTYFVTKEATQKITNIKNTPVVSFTAYDEREVLCGQIRGEVEILTDMHEVASRLPSIQQLLDEQRQQYWVPPIAQLKAGSYVLCKLTPQQVQFTDYSSYSVGKEAEPRVFSFDLSDKTAR